MAVLFEREDKMDSISGKVFTEKRKFIFLLALLCTVFFCTAFPAAAQAKGWTAKADGTYVFKDASGRSLEGRYFPSRKLGIVTRGTSSYCYRKDGSRYTGLLKFGKKWYYFNPKNGRMLVNRRVKIGKKYYYFGEDGLKVMRTWVGRRYYGRSGAQLFGRFIGKRYVNAKGLYVKGLKTLKGSLYFFDMKTGEKVTNDVRTVGGKSYYFDSAGKGQRSTPYGTIVEPEYFTDPTVDDETLLSAIIYCEAGNQPYYGQLAVGLVIMNRIRHPEFPSHLKDVIYAVDQFEPARNSWLTKALQGKMAVTDSCRKAAKEALQRSESGNLKIKNTDTKKTVNMSGYLFFMTPASFVRLQLKSEHIVLRDHVFFKNWER